MWLSLVLLSHIQSGNAVPTKLADDALKTLPTVAGVSVSLLVILMIGTNTCIHLRISALSSVSSVDVASGRSTAHCQGMELCEQKKAYV